MTCALVLTAAAQAAPLAPPWRESPELARIFTPQGVPSGAYRVYTSDLSLEEALKQVTTAGALSAWPDAWKTERLGPVDAFGQGASYNRWAIARLYGATTARVARGPRMDGGQAVEVWTLISPYPNAALDRLEHGTLLIVLNVR